MSKSPIRKDKTCLNCRYVVENRFCPNCGQENTDTRKTFYHLFIHFFEDLTHYKNAFWKTIRNLLFKPASLTKEYLSGKRLSYLAPVRLYIFISFITFFLITVFPNSEESIIHFNETRVAKSVDNNIKKLDTFSSKKNEIKRNLKNKEIDSILKDTEKGKGFLDLGYKSVKEIDSIQKYGKQKEKLGSFEYWIAKKITQVNTRYSRNEIIDKLLESSSHNFPKVLLIYMPLFAFFLWLFHGKKRWYYFDHGIFTLHYFSFLLLIYLLIFLFIKITSLFGDSIIIDSANFLIKLVGYFWMLYYFLPAHRRFYGESRWISLLKSISLFLINLFFMTIILTLFFIYTLLNIH